MRLLLVGDVMLGRLVNRALETKPPEYPWGDTLCVFRAADARICNLECVISDAGVPWSATPKAFHFRTDSKNIAVLEKAGIDAVALANNHTLDFEYEAMYSMLDTLDGAGIARAGAGREIVEASSPSFIDVKGVRCALISFTDNEPGWEADEKTPGVFYVPIRADDWRAGRLFGIVREAKRNADIVIVSAHWGPNWGYRPAPGHPPFAHALIDSGADIVFGHSCHVFQGVEVYRARPVIYSAGNFIDDYAVDELERNDESFVFIVEADGAGIKAVKMHPTMISRFQARLPRDFLAEEIAFKMKNLCRELGTEARWLADENCLEAKIS